MKKIISRIGAVALVVAMLCAMAIISFANPSRAITNQTVEFKNVEAGDTVNAYKLVSYAADYNSYVFTRTLKHSSAQRWRDSTM